MKSVIVIDSEGNLSGLSDDVLDRLQLGKKTVTRVSDVEFNETTQCWEARALDQTLIASGPIRSAVIAAERVYFANKTLAELAA